MTEAFLMVENALLKEEVRILRAQVSACNHVLEKNLKDLLRENWRPHPEVLDIDEKVIT